MNRPARTGSGESVLDVPVSSAQRRKRDSRERMLTAAAELFLQKGYIAVSVEDVALAAGVSRMTFYRHFRDKVELSVALFNQEVTRAMPRLLRIAGEDYRDRTVVWRWIADVFAADRQERSLLRVFSQASSEGAGFTGEAQGMIQQLIVGLGKGIPAFRLRPNKSQDRRRWLQAWLLIYEILDQSNHAALDSGIAGDPLVVDILADRFLTYVNDSASANDKQRKR